MAALDNPKWEAFAQDVAMDVGPPTAYRKHVARGKCADTTANTEARRLLKKPSVALRIAELKGVISQKAGEKFDWNAEKALGWLKSVLETPVGSIDESHPLCQEVSFSPTGGKKIKMPAKLDALRLMAQMAGWMAPEEHRHKFELSPQAEAALDAIFGGRGK